MEQLSIAMIGQKKLPKQWHPYAVKFGGWVPQDKEILDAKTEKHNTVRGDLAGTACLFWYLLKT